MIKAEKRSVISLRKDKFEEMRDTLGIPRTTLYAALGGRSNSKQAQKIREQAMSVYGGIKTTRPIY